MAAVSSTGKRRVALERIACTAAMPPTSEMMLFTSWMRFSRIGPPRALVRIGLC
jgi:hypothetical protein